MGLWRRVLRVAPGIVFVVVALVAVNASYTGSIDIAIRKVTFLLAVTIAVLGIQVGKLQRDTRRLRDRIADLESKSSRDQL